jgi:hypothetical protein
MIITQVQRDIVNRLKDAGYENVKEHLLVGITENEPYPFIVVDLGYSLTHVVASGKYTNNVHYLTITCFQKASIGITEARESAIQAFENVMDLLNLPILEEKIEYIDTVMNSIKICGVGCVVEVSAY